MGRRLTTTAVLGAALALAAQAGAAGPKTGCTLLTKAEVGATIGEGVTKTQGGRSATGAVFCNWTGKDEGLFPKGISLVGASDNAKQRYAGYASLLEKRTPVAGVGVQAVTDGNVILARSGRAVVQVGATYVNSGIAPAKLKALVKKALARL